MSLELPKKLNMSLPTQISSSRSYIIEIVLLVIVGFLIGTFLVMPKKDKVDAQKEVLSSYEAEQSKMNDNLDALKRMVSQLKTHTSDITKLNDAIPLEGKTTSLHFLFQELAGSSGVVISDINVVGVPGIIAGNTELIKNPYGSPRTLQKLTGNIFVVGNFSQLENFLKKVEASGRIVNINNVEVQSALEGSVSLSLSFESYFLAP